MAPEQWPMRVGDSNADMSIFGTALDEFLYEVADILLMLKYVRRPDQVELSRRIKLVKIDMHDIKVVYVRLFGVDRAAIIHT
jgi:hypothetical protein